MILRIQIVTYTSGTELRDKVVRFITHSRSKEVGGKESDGEPEQIPAGKRQTCGAIVVLRRLGETEVTDSSRPQGSLENALNRLRCRKLNYVTAYVTTFLHS